MSMAISGVNPNVCSFKGDSVKSEDKKVKDVSAKVEEVANEINETGEALAHGMDGVTKCAGTVGTSAIGLWTIAKKPIVGVYEFFTDVVIDKTTGKPVIQDVFDSHGNKKINQETGEAITKVLRKANWKKIGIVGGVVAASVALFAIVNKIKNNKAEKAEDTKTEAVKVESEEV